MIGNGWISPVEQYQAYLSFAYKEGMVPAGTEIARKVEAQQSTCLSALSAPGGTDKVDLQECEEVLQTILRLTQTNKQCYNMYDIRLRDSFPSCGMNWPPDLTSVTPYLRRQDVVSALHINKDKRTGWTECSGAVGSNFRARNSAPSITLLPGLLEEDLPIVLFSGAKDFICNHIGTEELIHNMKWAGGTGFELSPGTWAPRRDWTFEGEPAGIYQEARNLTYILFYNSSHMVPFDYPRRTRDMLDRFLGVDIASIGGTPADSRIDGEKGLETSVGGHPNSTLAEEQEKEKLKQAEWKGYYRSGEAVLVIVIIAAAAWGWYVLRDRRRRRGYTGVYQNGHTGPNGRGGAGLEAFRSKRTGRDVEAGDFDESELDELHVQSPVEEDLERERYSVGGDSDEDTPKINEANGKESDKERG